MDAPAAFRWWQEVSACAIEETGCGAVLLLLRYGPPCREVASSGKLPIIVGLYKSKHRN